MDCSSIQLMRARKMRSKRDSEDYKRGYPKTSDLFIQRIVGSIIVLICLSIIFLVSVVFKRVHKGRPQYMTLYFSEAEIINNLN